MTFRLVPALLLLLTLGASADGLRVLTGAGMAMPVRVVAADFAARHGLKVDVVSDTAGGVQKRVEAGEQYDLVIATTTVMDALAADNRVAVQHHALAQMVAGIGVNNDDAMPDIADAQAVKKMLLDAKSIAYVDPASGGITGVFFLQQADRLGIGSQVRAKAVLEKNGSGVAEAVASGKAQAGVTLVSEMLPNRGVRVAPLPDELQMTTIYAGAVSNDAQNTLDAALLLDDLRGTRGREAALKAGLKPVSADN